MGSDDSWERAKEEVRERVDIVTVVEDYVTLEDRGKHHFGLCPFHAEDTASFCVTPEMGIFKCFGCGESGDVFSFLMKIESLEFPEALRMLAERVGIELPESDEKEADPRRDILEYAADCYRKALWGEDGKEALDYLRDRGYSEEFLKQFGVGFAPEGWRNLARALKRDGYELEQAFEVGLLSQNEEKNTIYDRFRNRVMFPISSPSGRVLGFGGRNLPGNEHGPKYLNSPESSIFQKREVLYGIHQGRGSLRKTGRALMMEGYTDVLMAHQEGWTNAVATLGTAMTAQHVEQLNRYVDEVVLIYDGDEAGRRAAKRGGEEAFRKNLDVSVVLMDEQQDPDDLLKEDPEQFQELVDSARSYLEFRLEWLRANSEVSGIQLDEKLIEDLGGLIGEIDSELRRSKMVGWLASELGVEEQVVQRELTTRKVRNEKKNGDPEETALNRRLSLEQLLFRRVAREPETTETVVDRLSLKDFKQQTHKDLFRGLKELLQTSQEASLENWRNTISMECNEYLTSLLSWSPDDEMNQPPSAVELAESLKQLQSRRERRKLARTLAEQDREGEPGKLDDAKKALLREAQNNRVEHGIHETENGSI